MGRSTLLSQVADQLQAEQVAFHQFKGVAELRESLSYGWDRQSRDLRPIVRWLGMRANGSSNGRVMLLVDDFDLTLTDEQQSLVLDLLGAQPLLQLVTVSMDLPGGSDTVAGRGLGRVERVGADALRFTRDELEQMVASVVQRPTAPSRLAHDDYTAAVVGQLAEISKGVPLAVVDSLTGLPLERNLTKHMIEEAMNRCIVEAMRARMRVDDQDGVSAMCRTFSLMPRFSFLHIAACFPHATSEVLEALAGLPVLDVRRRVRAGVYAWSEEFLYAARELNAPRASERRSLAAVFYRKNLAGEAFEQWFLAGDMARAEAMLRTRFLTVHETLSPETAHEVSMLAPSELAAFPMIRVMQTLLEQKPLVAELRQSIENLGAMGGRGGAVGTLAFAVRAAALARKGSVKLAYEQAEQVLRLVRDHPFGALADTEAEQRTYAEAALVAVLAQLEVGTIPSEMSTLPRAHGSAFLRHRRETTQQLLDSLRAEPVVRHSLLNSGVPHSYRALVCSEAQCELQIAELEAYDQRFVETVSAQRMSATRGSVAGTGSHVEAVAHTSVRFFTEVYECIRLLSLDDQAGAVEVAFRGDVCEPHASTLQAMMLLITGRALESKELLDSVTVQQSARIEAVRVGLRAAALLQLGQAEPARSEVSRLEGLPVTVVVQAFSLLRTEDARQLSQLNPNFSDHVEAAAATGALGTGVKLMARKRFQSLTEKEREVLLGLREGLNTRQIAERDFLSVNTVRTHVRSIGKKLDASGQAEMLRRAEELRLFRDA